MNKISLNTLMAVILTDGNEDKTRTAYCAVTGCLGNCREKYASALIGGTVAQVSIWVS